MSVCPSVTCSHFLGRAFQPIGTKFYRHNCSPPATRTSLFQTFWAKNGLAILKQAFSDGHLTAKNLISNNALTIHLRRKLKKRVCKGQNSLHLWCLCFFSISCTLTEIFAKIMAIWHCHLILCKPVQWKIINLKRWQNYHGNAVDNFLRE